MNLVQPLILVVDDEPDIRSLVKDILEDEGYEVRVAENAVQARASVQAQAPDLVLLDIWMPDIDGISLLKEFVEAGLRAPVVMISGHGTVESAVEATRLGAFDFIEKPLSLGKLLRTVQRALETRATQKEIATRRAVPQASEPVGKSALMQRLRDQVRRVAPFDTWVLMGGEEGVGKQLCARYLHACSPRRGAPFVAINAAAIPRGKADEVLFGREHGGEVRKGYFEEAHGGTLYISDIAELELSAQARLLDIYTARSVKRVGGMKRIEVNVRLVAATRLDAQECVANGTFREDLWFRINEIGIAVPPLREHCEDIPELLNHFTDLFVNEEQLGYRKFSLAAQNWLRNHHWPGNVRELRNLVHRLLILGSGQDISAAEVEAAIAAQSPSAAHPSTDVFGLPLREARDQFEKSYLEYHLKQSGGNVGLVAKQSGMERTHLYRKFRALGIDPRQIKDQKE